MSDEAREQLFKKDWYAHAHKVGSLNDFTMGWGRGFDAAMEFVRKTDYSVDVLVKLQPPDFSDEEMLPDGQTVGNLLAARN